MMSLAKAPRAEQAISLAYSQTPMSSTVTPRMLRARRMIPLSFRSSPSEAAKAMSSARFLSTVAFGTSRPPAPRRILRVHTRIVRQVPDPDSRISYEADPELLERARHEVLDQPAQPWEA